MSHDHASGLSRRAFLRRSATVGAAVGVGSLFPQVRGLSAALAATSTGPLRAGVGVADITPGNGGTFFGYVRPDRFANGIAVRLYARTIVLHAGDDRVALVTVDLGASLDKAAVVDRVADLGLGMDTVLLCATHTHAGPEEWTDWLEERIATSVRRAHEDLAPARAAWARGTVDGVNQCRSVEAHLANHGLDVPPGEGSPDLDPEGPDHVRDLDLRLLRVDRADGTPLTAWSVFAVHPTNFPNTNTLLSADLSGLAVRRFEATFAEGPDADGFTTATAPGAPVGILANGNQGDLISRYESHNPHSSADLMGLRLAAGMRRLWDEAGTRLDGDVAIGTRWTRMGYEGQVVDDEGHRVADQALWGLPFLGGAKNGPSPFHQDGTSEGIRRPAELADPVQGRKVVAGPAPWRNDPELQLVRVGSQLLVAVPGEATTETGRRANAAALAVAPPGVSDSVLVGLANDYVGYFTTPEEYDQQHYEGGHTVFGKYTSLLLVRTGADLVGALARGEPAPPPAAGRPSPYPPDGGAGGGVGEGADAGAIAAEPPCDVARFDVVGVKWDGGERGLDRPVDGPFVVVERRRGDGTWKAIDSDLGVAMHWTEEQGRYLATWDVARDAMPGVHRFRITAARYELVSAPFAVAPSRGLVVRGAELVDGRLVVRAQHPAPDPERHHRYRERSARGGHATVLVDGRRRVARWDRTVAGWVATIPGLAVGDTVEVPTDGLVDDAGNTSGDAVTVTVGEVAPVVWPEDMAVGGTDRDWHGHAPSEVEVSRPDGCVVPAAGDDPDGPEGPVEGAAEPTPPPAGGVAADGAPLPATGGGAGLGAVVAAVATAVRARGRPRGGVSSSAGRDARTPGSRGR